MATSDEMTLGIFERKVFRTGYELYFATNWKHLYDYDEIFFIINTSDV